MRVMVFGASGFLGEHVYQRLHSQSANGVQVVGTCSKYSQSDGLMPIDLESAPLVKSLVREVHPDAVIWSVKAREGVDESTLHEGGLSSIVNEVGGSSRLIFVSSDAVLPGTEGHYSEETTPARSAGTSWLDRYINAKIEAEVLIRQGCSNFCIVRTGPIFGRRINGDWDARTHGILSALERGERIERPWNLVRTYCYVEDLADSLCELLFSNVQGVLHVGARTPASHFEFATAVAQWFGYPTSQVNGFEISSDEAKRQHVRLDTSMDTSRALECLTTRFRDLRQALTNE